TGRTENNNYKNSDGNMVYTNQDIAETIEFAESKKAQEEAGNTVTAKVSDDFMNIPDSALSDDGLPFK
ncbi:MAG: single-stranded DNA-binding protein, partial [Psychrobacillus sp.]